MTTVRLRPTFRLPLQVDRDTAINDIRARLAADSRFAGRWCGKGRWAEICVPSPQRRFWSPHLSIRIDEEDAGGSVLFGRFAPHPEVWTFFMFLYIGISFLVVFGSIFAYVQWVSDQPAWALWSVWLGVPALGLIHLAGFVGQRLGYDQMVMLRGELNELLEGLQGIWKEGPDAHQGGHVP